MDGGGNWKGWKISFGLCYWWKISRERICHSFIFFILSWSFWPFCRCHHLLHFLSACRTLFRSLPSTLRRDKFISSSRLPRSSALSEGSENVNLHLYHSLIHSSIHSFFHHYDCQEYPSSINCTPNRHRENRKAQGSSRGRRQLWAEPEQS